MTDPDDDLVNRLRDEYVRVPADRRPIDVRALSLRARHTRRRRRARVMAVVLAAVVVIGAVGFAIGARSGRGPDAATAVPPATTTYDGPLDAEGRFGAAGRAVDCVYRPVGSRTTSAVYDGGATSDTPTAAVETAYSEGLFLSAPDVDLAVAARDDERQLLTYEVDGRVLMALLLRDGPATQGAGGAGWYVEAFARCDFAEFPEADARTVLMQYHPWTDRHGVPVPVAKVYSGPGAERCDWERMTFLYLDDGGRRSRTYVEAPVKELLRYVAGPYRETVELPSDATDTGWEREGNHLWLSADGDYAYVGSVAAVAAWPRFESGCA